jgi:ABC-2 type transport system permease protein
VSVATATAGTLPRLGFGHALASEWTKLWSVRSTWVSIGLALVLSIGLTAMLAAVIGATMEEWSPAEQAAFDPILFSFAGALFTIILLSVLGVMFVSAEYSSGMIRLTLTITPARGRILLAKVLLVMLVSLVVGVISSVGMFVVGQAIFEGYGIETAGLTDADALRAVLGVGLTTPVFPIIAAAFGFLLRSTAGAITAVLATLFVPEIFGPLLPEWWRENVLAYLPGAAADAISIAHLDPTTPYADPWVGGLVVVGWLVLFVGLAYLMLRRRDA